ncbi:TPR-like protein [Clavulina sp. PMI_390]|nr:TPR-like protein [Clavulina sp. PMI_390]
MSQTPARRSILPIASGTQQRHPRESLSEGVSLGPESLLHTLAVTSPRIRGTETPQTSSRSTNKKGKSKLASLVHPSASSESLGTATPGSSSSDADQRGVLVDRFRLWRQDAIMQHLYETAIFWGDKVFSWTADPNDAFWLAQAHFLSHHYLRAESILIQSYAYQTPRATTAKGKEREDLLRGNMPLMGGIDLAPTIAGGYSRLVDLSVACRYLAAQCSVRLGKWDDALEMLGETNPFRGKANEPPPVSVPEQHGGVKVESTMCYLRGVIMLRMGRARDAQESLMEALAIDYKNFDAFETLIGGDMLTIDEEWEFVQGLEYNQDDPYAAEFVRSVYMIRLKKYKHHDEMAAARRRLVVNYDMGENTEVLLGFAESLFSQFRYADCFAITSRILENTKIHPPTLRLHIACMQQLPNQRPKLFLLAHELMQKEPESPISSYAVASWYIFAKKYPMARRWIAKTTLMDPRNEPAWIAFAHTFAFEGEHDQAITAYSTCARLFRGSHLPLLYIGMEYLRLSNRLLAEEYFEAAYKLCDSDPLLLNEMGVLAYQSEKYGLAKKYLSSAAEIGSSAQKSEAPWKNTYLNLGQALRKLGELEEAKTMFLKVLALDPRSAEAFASLGMVHHSLNELDAAITRYHEALSIIPLDANVIELLNIALAVNAMHDPLSSSAFTSTASSQETTNAQVFIAAGAGVPPRKPGGLSLPAAIRAALHNGTGAGAGTGAMGPVSMIRADVNHPSRVGTNPSWSTKMTATQERFGGRPEDPGLPPLPRGAGPSGPAHPSFRTTMLNRGGMEPPPPLRMGADAHQDDDTSMDLGDY